MLSAQKQVKRAFHIADMAFPATSAAFWSSAWPAVAVLNRLVNQAGEIPCSLGSS